RAHGAEVDRVRDAGGRGEWFGGQHRGGAGDLLLDVQGCSVGVGLVPVVAVGPTQHVAEVAAGERADGTRLIHLAVADDGAEHRAIGGTARIGDVSGAAGDGERGADVRVATPCLTVRRGAPQRLVRALE